MPTEEDHIANFYVSRANWLVGRGREDVLDAIADEFERPCRQVVHLEAERDAHTPSRTRGHSEPDAGSWQDRLAG
jgi:hypothetical protein